MGVFIHWEASDDAKIQQYNYEATKLSIERAVRSEPSARTMVEQKDKSQPSLRRWLKGISGSTKAGARTGPRRTQAAPGGTGEAGPGGSGATPGSSEHRLVEVPAPVLGSVAVVG